MKKKIITILLSICFLTTSTISIKAIDINGILEKNEKYLPKIDTTDLENLTYVFEAFGPVRKITEIELISGPENEIQKIDKELSRRIFFPIIRTTKLVTNLTFKITFTKPEKNFTRNWYTSAFSPIEEDENITTIMNQPHSYTIENFTGIFTFIRPRLFKFICLGPRFFRPYRFIILGGCENITENITLT